MVALLIIQSVVQGITEYGADSADEILELLHRGNMHRAVEPTAANQVSSRSHAVVQLSVAEGASGDRVSTIAHPCTAKCAPMYHERTPMYLEARAATACPPSTSSTSRGQRG